MVGTFVLPHMGLGDMIVLAGLVRSLAARTPHIVMPAKEQYLPALRQLFRGLGNLDLMAVRDDDQVSPAYGADGRVLGHYALAGYQIVRLGLHAGSGSAAWDALHPNFSHRFYIQAGLDHSLSYTGFQLHRDRAREAALYARVVARLGEHYIFLHEDARRGFVVDRALLPTEFPAFTAHDPEISSDNIFDYCMVLERAQELHFMDSCFGLLADRLPGVTRPMTCHAYARDNSTHPSLYAKCVKLVYRAKGAYATAWSPPPESTTTSKSAPPA